MVDRVIVYPGALPQTTDILSTNKFGMVGQAYQNRAILGTNTVVSGLACTPTSPTPDLHVTVGVGSIYQMDPTDQTAYGDLGVDNNNIVKQGILPTPIALSITPPGTVGFSQVYLVEAILNDVDAGPLTLSYFNSVPPNAPFAGPANSGTSNFTTRTCPCVIAVKAGVAATTGTQVTPAPDAGYVGLYAVTVVNGQTQITSPNIVQLASAPFFPTLPSVPTNVQNGSWVYALDTGAVNALVITPINPQTTALVAGMGFRVKVLVTNTGASTITINGSSVFGPIAIRRATGVALSANDMISGQIVELVYDGTNFQMVNYLGAAATTSTITNVFIPYVVDSGTPNAIVATYSPVITSGQQIAGLFISVKLANTITGACTINVNGLGLKSVLTGDLANPPNAVYVAGEVLLLGYDGTQYQIVNTSSLTYRKPIANTTIFVNGAIGNDANDGVSNTAGHALATIQAGVNKAFGYAPSQFTLTVQIAAGTYNESVVSPTYAGPNLVISGVSTAAVIVSSGSGSCFQIGGPNTVTIQNLTVQNSGSISPNFLFGFAAFSGAVVNTNNTASNTCSVVFATSASGTLTPTTHTFNGSGGMLWYAAGGTIDLGGNTVFSFANPISLAIGGAVATTTGYIFVNTVAPPSFVNPGFVSGIKYEATVNGVIWQSGLGVNYFPGTIAGLTQNGGQAIT
jgi:hypothetical protein